MKIPRPSPSSWRAWVRARFDELPLARFRRAPKEALQEVEQHISGVFRPVSAPADFRRELAENLALIARRKEYGLVVTHPHPYRLGIWIGIGAGTLATLIAVMVLVFKGYLERRSTA